MKTTVIAPLRSSDTAVRASKPRGLIVFARRLPLALAVILAGMAFLAVAAIMLPIRWMAARFRR